MSWPRWLSAVALLLGLVLLPTSTAAQPAPNQAADWAVAGGHFFTQTASQGRGYLVTDEGDQRFWSEVQRLGGTASLGFPISQRLVWNGSSVQVFQRAALQWVAECGCARAVDVLDRLHDAGKDDWLFATRQVPRKSATPIGAAALDAYPALKARYAALADPGSLTSPVTELGSHLAVRTQRLVLQQWKQDMPWARQGEVTLALVGDILKQSGLLGDLTGLASVPSPTPLSQPRVLAYYVPYDATSWASLEANASAFDTVGAQWVTIDACGNLGSRDDRTLRRFADDHGLQIFPSLLTGSGALNHRLLTDPDTSHHAIDEIVRYVVDEGYPGFDLDFEGIPPDDRDAYTAFVAQLGAALHGQGRLLSLALPAKDRETTTGWGGWADYAALGDLADLFTIMTYEYRGPFSGPGSIAPYDWVDRVITFATHEMPAHKVLVGLPFYGYDWDTTRGTARALSYAQGAALADRYSVPIAFDPATASSSFSYQAPFGDPPPPGSGLTPPRHEISQRTPSPGCDVAPPPGPSTPPPARPAPPPDAIQDHEVWIEEGTGAQQRLSIVDRHAAGGIATWRLGQEDPRVWNLVRDWRAVVNP
jgi:glycosyl hydrolase family 18 (putative chitinase)